MDEMFRVDPPTERRAHPRYEVMAQVRVEWEAVTYVLDVRDISVSGLFLATTDPALLAKVRIDQHLRLDLFAAQELVNVGVTARVVRVVGGGTPELSGFGVQFVAPDEATRARIGAMVKRAAAAAAPPPLPRPSDR